MGRVRVARRRNWTATTWRRWWKPWNGLGVSSGRPQVLIAHTVKGKGVSFMEHNNQFHGRATTDEELERAELA